jgi:hypothetical protein
MNLLRKDTKERNPRVAEYHCFSIQKVREAVFKVHLGVFTKTSEAIYVSSYVSIIVEKVLPCLLVSLFLLFSIVVSNIQLSRAAFPVNVNNTQITF